MVAHIDSTLDTSKYSLTYTVCSWGMPELENQQPLKLLVAYSVKLAILRLLQKELPKKNFYLILRETPEIQKFLTQTHFSKADYLEMVRAAHLSYLLPQTNSIHSWEMVILNSCQCLEYFGITMARFPIALKTARALKSKIRQSQSLQVIHRLDSRWHFLLKQSDKGYLVG